MHDSVAFDEIYDEVLKEYDEEIENVCLDAGYNTPAICKKIKDSGKNALMPYSRQKGRKDKELMPKKEYEYNKEIDCYVCPTGEILELKSVDKQGYKIYKSKKRLENSKRFYFNLSVKSLISSGLVRQQPPIVFAPSLCQT